MRLHGKGGKWRTCPLWQQTARLLISLLGPAGPPPEPGAPVFAAHGQPLTRYGIYKIIRRHASCFDDPRTGRRVSPHTFRHTAAVHLLEAGVEVNVIRGWLGHADLATTNRYAEINTKTKLAALQATEPNDTSTDPGLTQSGDQIERCSTGLPPCDHYVAGRGAAQPLITGNNTASHRWPHNTAGHRNGTT